MSPGDFGSILRVVRHETTFDAPHLLGWKPADLEDMRFCGHHSLTLLLVTYMPSSLVRVSGTVLPDPRMLLLSLLQIIRTK